MKTSDFKISTLKISSDHIKLTLQGSFSASAEPVLKDQAQRAADPSIHIVELDFSELEHIDGSGLMLFLVFLTGLKSSKKTIRASGVDQPRAEWLELTGLGQLMVLVQDNTAEGVER